jgi:hypothetical protein
MSIKEIYLAYDYNTLQIIGNGLTMIVNTMIVKQKTLLNSMFILLNVKFSLMHCRDISHKIREREIKPWVLIVIFHIL